MYILMDYHTTCEVCGKRIDALLCDQSHQILHNYRAEKNAANFLPQIIPTTQKTTLIII